MNDMSGVIIPKSDQLSGDDLISGPRTIKITAVLIRDGTEQPVTIAYEGDDGRPYKPGKSMCRVMVALWGPDANAYIGRCLTLYRDPGVKWGGMEVGGIRISHMSNIPGAHTMALTQTKGSKKPFTVKPLVAEPKPITRPTRTPDAPAGLPLLASDSTLRRVSPSRYLEKIGEVLAKFSEPLEMRRWADAMRPHFATAREYDDELAHQAEMLVAGRMLELAGPPDAEPDEPGAVEPEGEA